MRFVFFSSGAPFIEFSTIEESYCNGCRIVQDIPQQVSVSESYSIKLCKDYLTKLAKELDYVSGGGNF